MISKFKDYKNVAPLISMGWILPCSIGVGVLIGYYIDKLFHSGPIGLIIFFVLGTIAGFVNLYRTYINSTKKDEK